MFDTYNKLLPVHNGFQHRHLINNDALRSCTHCTIHHDMKPIHCGVLIFETKFGYKSETLNQFVD